MSLHHSLYKEKVLSLSLSLSLFTSFFLSLIPTLPPYMSSGEIALLCSALLRLRSADRRFDSISRSRKEKKEKEEWMQERVKGKAEHDMSVSYTLP